MLLSLFQLPRWEVVCLCTAAALFVLKHMKGLPLTWTFRMSRVLFSHHIFNRSRVVSAEQHGPQALFQPVVTTSHCSIFEIDWNMHKSNSTFFTDLDISRQHLISTLFKKDLLYHGGSIVAMMGATLCLFRRDIAPNQGYEVWTRVLCWDQKWLYVISHFVKAGTSKSRWYALDPVGSRKSCPKGAVNGGAVDPKDIFATGLSKYVFKKGRITVPPEQMLDKSRLLPPKPLGEEAHTTVSDSLKGHETQGEAVEKVLDASIKADFGGVDYDDDHASKMDWQRVETERQRGYKIAGLMANFDALHDMIPGRSERGLINFSDW